MPLNPTQRQLGYLLSSGSPLSPHQKNKFKSELHSGKAKIRPPIKEGKKNGKGKLKVNAKEQGE